MNLAELLRPQLDRLQRMAIAGVVVGLILCVAGVMLSSGGLALFFQSYLFAYLFWFGVTVGSLALLMVQHVTGGGWGFILRRPLEAGSRLLPLMALLFIPIVIGIPNLYPWSDANLVEHDEILKAQHPYMNFNFFVIRAVIYFVIWMLLAYFLNKWSARQDATDDPQEQAALWHRENVVSAGGLVVYVLTVSFAAIDWVMTLTPHWFSSIIGLLFVAAQGLSTFALMHILVATVGKDKPPLNEVPHRYFRDLGNLTLAFVMLWAYMSYSQYLITYSGSTAVESSWYSPRTQNGWQWIALSLIFAHFALPFLVLLSSSVKVKMENLARLAAFILFMRFVDMFWWVVPTFRKNISINLADIGAPLLIGGIWLVAWVWQIRGKELIPIHDPRLQEHWPLREVAHHG